MKEFALKHPWMTFFLVDGIVSGVVKIICTALNRGKDQTAAVECTLTTEEPEKEEKEEDKA